MTKPSIRHVKIVNTEFANKKRLHIQKVQIKGKTYQQASCLIEYDDITFEEQTYTVVRITINDRKGKKIFKEPPRMLTNRKIKTIKQAHGVYLTYLKRFKIEDVFKFLKDVLGWIEIQVRDLPIHKKYYRFWRLYWWLFHRKRIRIS
jgi:hypothetical protein